MGRVKRLSHRPDLCINRSILAADLDLVGGHRHQGAAGQGDLKTDDDHPADHPRPARAAGQDLRVAYPVLQVQDGNVLGKFLD